MQHICIDILLNQRFEISIFLLSLGNGRDRVGKGEYRTGNEGNMSAMPSSVVAPSLRINLTCVLNRMNMSNGNY